jgi:hypothetical protein
MRKAIESDYVSANIHHWIDLIWGFQQRGDAASLALNTYPPTLYDSVWTARTLQDPAQRAVIEASLTHIGQIPPQLFRDPHPVREKGSLLSPLSLPKVIVALDILKDATDALLAFEKGQIALSVAACDDRIEFRLDLASGRVRQTAQTRVGGRAIRLIGGPYSLLDSGVVVPRPHHLSNPVIDAVFADGFFAGIVNGSALRLIGPSLNSAVQFYGDVIRCCTVSRTFKIAVCGTIANHIVIVSLFAGEKVMVVDIGLKPIAVIVTEGWGFIVVRAIDDREKEFLVVLDVNGRQLRRVKAPAPIRCWSPWRSRDGFDYILIATARGGIFNIEVFYCEFGEPICWESAPVIALAYFEEVRTAILLTDKSIVCIRGDSFPP